MMLNSTLEKWRAVIQLVGSTLQSVSTCNQFNQILCA
jgi:hypothetical protein